MTVASEPQTAPSTETARSSWRDTFAVYLQPRVLIVLFLGFSAGLPLALSSSTLTIWMREVGVDLGTIGLFTLVGTPYTIKFLWAPVVLALGCVGSRQGGRGSAYARSGTMTEKKKLKRAIRARAEAEGVSYQEMRRRMGVGAAAPTALHEAVTTAAGECLRRAKEPPRDVAIVAGRIAAGLQPLVASGWTVGRHRGERADAAVMGAVEHDPPILAIAGNLDHGHPMRRHLDVDQLLGHVLEAGRVLTFLQGGEHQLFVGVFVIDAKQPMAA